MAVQHIDVLGQSSQNPMNPAVWKDMPLDSILMGNARVGYGLSDDFVLAPTSATAPSSVAFGNYVAYGDAGTTIGPYTGGVGGALLLTHDGNDNDEISVQVNGAPFLISDTSGSDRKLVFEARVQKSSVTNDVMAMFLGLGEEGLAAANTLVDTTGALASKDFIGFHVDQADGDSIDFVYRKAGQDAQVLISGVSAMVADTAINLGFVYDPEAAADKRIKVFVNGVEQGTYVTATQIAAATFPDGEELAPLFATKLGSDTACTALLEYWACAQLR